MRTLAEILDAFEAELALENELGVRLFSCDRSLLVTGTAAKAPVPETAAPKPPLPPQAAPAPKPAAPSAAVAVEGAHDFVFLHHAPLSPQGVEMMSKIITALGKKADVPILFNPPRPKTRFAVVLGGAALKKWFPNMRVECGRWAQADDGTWVYVTYSPTYLLRFGESQQLHSMKLAMWRGLNDLMRKIES